MMMMMMMMENLYSDIPFIRVNLEIGIYHSLKLG